MFINRACSSHQSHKTCSMGLKNRCLPKYLFHGPNNKLYAYQIPVAWTQKCMPTIIPVPWTDTFPIPNTGSMDPKIHAVKNPGCMDPKIHAYHNTGYLYYYTSRMQMSLNKYVLFQPCDRNSTAIITKTAGFLRNRLFS